MSEQCLKIQKEIKNEIKDNDTVVEKRFTELIGKINDQNISRTKIDSKIDNILTHFIEGGIVWEIRTEAKKTNGRINKLESWRNKILGGFFVIMLFGATMVALTKFYLDAKYASRDDLIKIINEKVILEAYKK